MGIKPKIQRAKGLSASQYSAIRAKNFPAERKRQQATGAATPEALKVLQDVAAGKAKSVTSKGVTYTGRAASSQARQELSKVGYIQPDARTAIQERDINYRLAVAQEQKRQNILNRQIEAAQMQLVRRSAKMIGQRESERALRERIERISPIPATKYEFTKVSPVYVAPTRLERAKTLIRLGMERERKKTVALGKQRESELISAKDMPKRTEVKILAASQFLKRQVLNVGVGAVRGVVGAGETVYGVGKYAVKTAGDPIFQQFPALYTVREAAKGVKFLKTNYKDIIESEVSSIRESPVAYATEWYTFDKTFRTAFKAGKFGTTKITGKIKTIVKSAKLKANVFSNKNIVRRNDFMPLSASTKAKIGLSKLGVYASRKTQKVIFAPFKGKKASINFFAGKNGKRTIKEKSLRMPSEKKIRKTYIRYGRPEVLSIKNRTAYMFKNVLSGESKIYTRFPDWYEAQTRLGRFLKKPEGAKLLRKVTAERTRAARIRAAKTELKWLREDAILRSKRPVKALRSLSNKQRKLLKKKNLLRRRDRRKLLIRGGINMRGIDNFFKNPVVIQRQNIIRQGIITAPKKINEFKTAAKPILESGKKVGDQKLVLLTVQETKKVLNTPKTTQQKGLKHQISRQKQMYVTKKEIIATTKLKATRRLTKKQAQLKIPYLGIINATKQQKLIARALKTVVKQKPKQISKQIIKQVSRQKPKQIPKQISKQILKQIPKQIHKQISKQRPKQIPRQILKQTPKQKLKTKKLIKITTKIKLPPIRLINKSDKKKLFTLSKSQSFQYTSDLAALLLGQRAKKGMRSRLLKKGRAFTGLERRFIV